MPQYCDSAKLEQNWFHWLLSSSVPSLEKYRKVGLLWTRVIGVVTDADGSPIMRHGKTLPNPSHPVRAHCIALATPLHFQSIEGVSPEVGTVFNDTVPQQRPLPTDDELNLLSDSPLHLLDSAPLAQATQVLPCLRSQGFVREVPTAVSWHAMLEDINLICQGIAMRFRPRSDDEHLELANDALLQVMNKLQAKKLVYTPGRAPVFNLLTTTIHRVMYSIMNRRKHQREGLHRILADAEAGVLPESHRSLRVQTPHRRRPIKTR